MWLLLLLRLIQRAKQKKKSAFRFINKWKSLSNCLPSVEKRFMKRLIELNYLQFTLLCIATIEYCKKKEKNIFINRVLKNHGHLTLCLLHDEESWSRANRGHD